MLNTQPVIAITINVCENLQEHLTASFCLINNLTNEFLKFIFSRICRLILCHLYYYCNDNSNICEYFLINSANHVQYYDLST